VPDHDHSEKSSVPDGSAPSPESKSQGPDAPATPKGAEAPEASEASRASKAAKPSAAPKAPPVPKADAEVKTSPEPTGDEVLPAPAGSPAASTGEGNPARPKEPEAPAPSSGKYRTLGLAMTIAGVALGVVPQVFAPAAELLQPLAGSLVPAGTLIVVGMVLFGIGVLHRAIGSLQGEVRGIAEGMPMMEWISAQLQFLQREFSLFKSTMGSARKDMDKLNESVQQLLALVSNQEFETSLFRMAASLDQLGERLDLSIARRIESIRQELSAFKDETLSANAGLASGLQGLDRHLQAQDSGQRDAETETRGMLQQSTHEARAQREQQEESFQHLGGELCRIEGELSERLGHQLHELREHVGASALVSAERLEEGWSEQTRTLGELREELLRIERELSDEHTGLGESSAAAVREASARLTELEGQTRELIQQSAENARSRDEQQAEALERVGGELRQLEQQRAQDVDRRLQELGEQVETSEQLAGERAQERWSECAQALGELREELGRVERAASAEDSASAAAATAAIERMTTELTALGTDLERVLEGQSSSLSNRFESLESRIAEVDSAACRRESDLAARLGDHEAAVEQSIARLCDALTGDLQTIMELAREPEPAPENAPRHEAPAAEPMTPEAVVETAEEPRGPLPFGHGVGSGGVSELMADAPGSPNADAHGDPEPSPAPESLNYPVERLGNEFGDGWIDG